MMDNEDFNPLHSVDTTAFPPTPEFIRTAHIKSYEEYLRLWKWSVDDPEGFWGKIGVNELRWIERFRIALEWNPPCAKFFISGKLNVSVNCLDAHVEAGDGDRIALVWEGEPEGDCRKFTFRELLDEVCGFANVLKNLGVRKGDRVCFYLPMIPELPIGMLACARIGAIHSVVMSGSNPEALRDRLKNLGAKVMVTCDGAFRSGKTIRMKDIADAALRDGAPVEQVVVVERAKNEIRMAPGRDFLLRDLLQVASRRCEPEAMDSEDPLFVLYTSGSTGKPKGIVHTQAGYLLYAKTTANYVFDLKQEDIFWCTADIGWITGHSYVLYGILANGVATVMIEGAPNYPDSDRIWRVVEKNRVTVFYTTPTAIRALKCEGAGPSGGDLGSLRLLGAVGEQMNAEAWIWYNDIVGGERCPVVDTWWQTETGGVMTGTLPGAAPQKPGVSGLPFFGIDPVVLRDDGTECEAGESGNLAIRQPWPGMLRGIFGDPAGLDYYFDAFSGLYTTGDGAVKDRDGYFRLLGRVDDVINVSGLRLGTAEIDVALMSHPLVEEAFCVPMPHDIKGQGIYAFVKLRDGTEKSDELKKELRMWVRKEVGPMATPDRIHFTEVLPKTNSGKIMGRILRRIAGGETEHFGDISTLNDPMVIRKLLPETE